MANDDQWRIDRLVLSNFRCFDEFALELTAPVTALVGKNGSGKTAVLDGLAIALSTVVKEFGGPSQGLAKRDARVIPSDLVSQETVATLEPVYPVKVAASAVLAGHDFLLQRVRETEGSGTTRGAREMTSFVRSLAQQASSDEGHPPQLPVLAYYGVERLMGGKRVDGYLKSSRSVLTPQRSTQIRFDSSLWIPRSVVRADHKRRRVRRFASSSRISQFESIQAACQVVLASTGWGRPRWNPVARELTLTHRSGQTLPLSWLASGIKIAAGLTIDLAESHGPRTPTLAVRELLASTPGIVMIDEVDLHLHPSWQQLIVPSLAEAFPRVQFLITPIAPESCPPSMGAASESWMAPVFAYRSTQLACEAM